jgi:hypothetical protein
VRLLLPFFLVAVGVWLVRARSADVDVVRLVRSQGRELDAQLVR